MTCSDFFQDVRSLHAEGKVEVAHEPMSERYQRAQMYLDDFISSAECIGCYEEIASATSKCIEVVAWQEPDSGRFIRDDKGAYGVFKVLYNDNGTGSFTPEFAELFGYYDGEPTEHDRGNHCVDTYEEAIGLMDTFGKYEYC